MRPKSTSKDLPPKLLRRSRKLKSGKVWTGYYYDGRVDGKRKEIPLGTDLLEAKRKWAELDFSAKPSDTGLMRHIFDRYVREGMVGLAPATHRSYLQSMKSLRLAFDQVNIDSITPQHIAQYRDARSAKVAANREISLLSVVFNRAREWGYTAKENPKLGVTMSKETPRNFYADKLVWDAVYDCASQVLKDAMDIAYLTGQRPADVRKILIADIQGGALEITQGKTGKRLRILLEGELKQVVDRIKARKVRGMSLILNQSARPLTSWMLRWEFDRARKSAAAIAGAELAARIKQFQFRDSRPKAASETTLEHAQQLLGHSKSDITRTVYRRVGEVVRPMK